ncbi:MAG: hypothetical protein U0836_19730 [Pirellulales bacterium]
MPCSVWLLALLAPTLAADDVQLTDGAKAHFATVEEARQVLSAHDDFAQAVSPFDRQARLQSAGPVSLDDWLAFNAAQAKPWSEAEHAKVEAALAKLAPKLKKFRLPLPEKILLVRTTGKEESGAAYTRQAAIVLPDGMLKSDDDKLERLLAHELFHVLSRHDAAWRERLYRVIGFEPMPAIELPGEWANRRITNPDAPRIDSRITLEIDGQSVTAAPVLYATPAEFDAQTGGSLFKHLTFRLLVLEQDDDRWRPKLENGQPVFLDPREQPDYARQIGENTGYIIHPDEILADNFVLLVRGERAVKTPRILEAMGALLEE